MEYVNSLHIFKHYHHNNMNITIQLLKANMTTTNIVLAFIVPLILLRSSLNRLTDDISKSISASVHFPLQETNLHSIDWHQHK